MLVCAKPLRWSSDVISICVGVCVGLCTVYVCVLCSWDFMGFITIVSECCCRSHDEHPERIYRGLERDILKLWLLLFLFSLKKKQQKNKTALCHILRPMRRLYCLKFCTYACETCELFGVTAKQFSSWFMRGFFFGCKWIMIHTKTMISV